MTVSGSRPGIVPAMARRRTASSAEEAWTTDETELGWDLDNPVKPTIAADRPFQLVSEFEPRGSQPQAITGIVQGLEARERAQVLLGITGSGKTFTIANVIAKVQWPTLILAHNKTLAAQLYGEFKALFPQTVFAQHENRHAAAKTPEDIAVTADRRFEGRLTRLHEAMDKNDVSAMTACYANLLGDMRSAIAYTENQAPGSRKLADMQNVLGRFENSTFDPMKPGELKPYLPNFDDFLNVLREK